MQYRLSYSGPFSKVESPLPLRFPTPLNPDGLVPSGVVASKVEVSSLALSRILRIWQSGGAFGHLQGHNCGLGLQVCGLMDQKSMPCTGKVQKVTKVVGISGAHN